MGWLLVILLFGGDITGLQVGPFQSEKACQVALKQTEDVVEEKNLAAYCVNQREYN